MNAQVRAHVALGSNLGDPLATLRSALGDLEHLRASRLVAVSPLYRTAPIGLIRQPDFINGVAALDTGLGPYELLAELFAIEARHGRLRELRHAPRTLDLDLLLYGDLCQDDAALTLPHPRMHERAFVLRPLVDLAPDLALPGRGSAAALLAALPAQRIDPL
ncbi:MAG: 2-amino-4-hydroxy-6-hydroxymethyldihydropteridine diphosphokinase [Rhodocyclaceae bacterium]|nr:2-amino-4-hydroxy-6-hydroxymethyldihydropteridine diphosphokinase [Rhodocyclaceae bacterium]